MDYINQSVYRTCEDEPKPKQFKTSQEGTVTSHWAHLPSLVLTEVFSMLNKEDRRNASLVCRSWRENYFQPRLWSSMKFSIQPDDLEKTEFLANTFGLTVTYARIVLTAVSSEHLKELIKLLQKLAKNNNLKELVIAYSPIDFEVPFFFGPVEDRSDDLAEVTNLLNMCLPKLSRFTADCMGALSLSVDTILENLNPSSVTRLGLTFMTKSSKRNRIDPALFKRLTKLEVLSIDQHTVTDELLDVLESCTRLKKFVVYHRSYRRTHHDSSGRAVSLHHSIHHKPSRRFKQLFRSYHLCCDIRPGNLGEEILVTQDLPFQLD